MITSLLIGLSSGARAMTPRAVVSTAAWARRRALAADNGAPAWLGHPVVATGTAAIAARSSQATS